MYTAHMRGSLASFPKSLKEPGYRSENTVIVDQYMHLKPDFLCYLP